MSMLVQLIHPRDTEKQGGKKRIRSPEQHAQVHIIYSNTPGFSHITSELKVAGEVAQSANALDHHLQA